ncbi:MAG: response regulator [Lentisphaeraceae bacterium]|nr:response regulator [Lentisphaeraceae bacterium]
MKDKKLILIVDDNPQNRKLLGCTLMSKGYDVGVSDDGPKALEFLKNTMPDLILLDVMMPGMDGFEVCSRLKRDCGTKHIPVIFLTAQNNTEDIVKGFEVGAVDYISKPFHNQELLARVKTHLELVALRGLLPICACCKSIHDKNDDYWYTVEEYISSRSDAEFSHSVCDACQEKLYGQYDWFKKMKNKKKPSH